MICLYSGGGGSQWVAEGQEAALLERLGVSSFHNGTPDWRALLGILATSGLTCFWSLPVGNFVNWS